MVEQWDFSVVRAGKLIEAGMVLAAELSLPAVLQRIVELATEITGARYGALGVMDADGYAIEEFITVGVSDDERGAIGHPPVGKGLLGQLIHDPHAQRISDIGSHPNSAGFPDHHPPMTSFLGAPVMARGRVFGNLYLTDKRGAPVFTEDDERAVVVLATQAGTAVENARLYEEATVARQELERLAVMEERERIARELHDGAIQALFAVGMELQGIAELSEDPDTQARIEGATNEIDRVIRDLRNYIFGLRPGILADRQLHQALQEMARDFEAKTGIMTVTDVESEAAAELASRAGDVVQLTREALSNVGRHAAAATCRISLWREGGRAILEIDDDGHGFDPSASKTGSGLRNMSERATGLGGEARVDSVPDEGSIVTVSIPI